MVIKCNYYLTIPLNLKFMVHMIFRTLHLKHRFTVKEVIWKCRGKSQSVPNYPTNSKLPCFTVLYFSWFYSLLHYFRYSVLWLPSFLYLYPGFFIPGARFGSFCPHFAVVYSSRTMHVLFLVLFFTLLFQITSWNESQCTKNNDSNLFIQLLNSFLF